MTNSPEQRSMKCRCKTFERLESRRVMAGDWQNPLLMRDVDDSALVNPIDALMIIDSLNKDGARVLPSRDQNARAPFLDVNGDLWLTPLDVLLVINAINTFGSRQPIVVGGLSPVSDPNSNGVVLTDRVTLSGQALANSVIRLGSMEQESGARVVAIADAEGRFIFNVTVVPGLQTLQLVARDDLGREAELQLDVRRGNAIQDWNASLLDIVRQWTTYSDDPYPRRIVTSQPPMVARNLAIVHTAMFEAVKAADAENQSGTFQLQAPTSTSAAAAAAAFEVAKVLYSAPDELAVWQATLDETLAQEMDAAASQRGVALGKRIGEATMDARRNDGALGTSTYQPSSEPGKWRRTYPDFLPPMLAHWPKLKTFSIASGDEFRPAPPPALDSAEYAAAVDQVMQLGAFQSTVRTAEQTEIALFWADGGGTFTPAGHWNQIAADVTLSKGTELRETARTFALINVAMADAVISSWDAKYYYDLWRPIDAIRLAESDGNPATTEDSSWIPLVKTPPFPSYTSGHSTFSGAASSVLAALFGDNTPFDSRADGHTGPEQRPLDPSQIVTRHYTSFSQAAEEAGASRVYGGIHFSFDDTAGVELGRQVGRRVIENATRQ